MKNLFQNTPKTECHDNTIQVNAEHEAQIRRIVDQRLEEERRAAAALQKNESGFSWKKLWKRTKEVVQTVVSVLTAVAKVLNAFSRFKLAFS